MMTVICIVQMKYNFYLFPQTPPNADGWAMAVTTDVFVVSAYRKVDLRGC